MGRQTTDHAVGDLRLRETSLTAPGRRNGRLIEEPLHLGNGQSLPD
jgi:hypothetical protein